MVNNYHFRADWVYNVDTAGAHERFLPVILYGSWTLWRGPAQPTTEAALGVAGERLRDRLAAVFADWPQGQITVPAV